MPFAFDPYAGLELLGDIGALINDAKNKAPAAKWQTDAVELVHDALVASDPQHKLVGHPELLQPVLVKAQELAQAWQAALAKASA